MSFAFIKATEGGDRFDQGFNGHWLGAARRASRAGAYHFYYFCTPARGAGPLVHRQRARASGGCCPRCSTWSGTRSPPPAAPSAPPAEEVRRQMRVFMDILARAITGSGR